MKTITLVAYNRPEYTHQALHGLARCHELTEFNRFVIFVDPGCSSVVEICESWASRLPVPTEVQVNPRRLGVAGNPERAYKRVFETLGSELNVAFEDDAVLSRDALRLALWFGERHGREGSRYVLLNLCDHDCYRGRGKNFGGVTDHPGLLAESRTLSSPFGWALSRAQWPFVQSHWNKNTRIGGWDFSLRFGMRFEGRIALTPVLSRCRNIGELGGTHDTPGTWAQVQMGLRHSDGAYGGPYRIVNPVSDADARRLSPWMIPELPRILGEKEKA